MTLQTEEEFSSLSVEQQLTNLTVIGCGQMDSNDSYPLLLIEAPLTYIPTEKCSQIRTPEYSFRNRLSPDMLCAVGDDESGVSFGD
jgi:hypothetical protein